MKGTEKICYLCGDKITSSCSRDHVPPRQLFPKQAREKLDLTTVLVHAKCNSEYQKDEEYFVSSLGPLAMETSSGKLVWDDLRKRIIRPESRKLTKKVLDEFDTRIVLPDNLIIKHFDGERICRVLWKITKGLYFAEKNQFLSDKMPKHFEIFDNSAKQIPERFSFLRSFSTRGKYPTIFDFRIASIPEVPNFMIIAMLFWEKIIGVVMFHEPGCGCDICKKL